MANLRVKVKDNMWGVKAHIPDSPLESNEHPRLLFTSREIPTIRTKLITYYGASSAYPSIQGSFQAVINECDSLYGTISDLTNARWYASTYALLSNLLPCSGFTSTHTPAQHGAEAARLIQFLTDNSDSITDGAWPGNILGFAYDWAFAYLSAQQRADAVALMKTLTSSANAIYNSPWAADSSKHCTCEAMFAAACAGDGIEDDWAAGVLAAYPTRIISATGVLGEESRVANLGPTVYGCGPQSGLSYSNYQWSWWVLHAEAVRTAYGITRPVWYNLTDYSAIPSVLYWWVYSISPNALASASFPNGFAWSHMRSQYSQPTGDVNQPASAMPIVFAGIWNEVEPEPAQLAMWYARQRIGSQPPTGYRIGQLWTYRFLLEDPTIAESSPLDLSLPISANFGDGRYEFKSAWDSNGITNTNWAVRFYAAKYLILGDGRGVHHLNGAWEIYRKGPQTIIRGPGAHNWAGHGAFNQLYFRDSNFVPPMASSSDYTFKLLGRVLAGSAPGATNRGNDLVANSQADYLGEVRSEFASGTHDCDYLFADLSKWYAGPKWTNVNNEACCVLYHDQKVLFRPSSVSNPVRVVVYRRYETPSTRFEPTCVWNASGDSMTVDGTETANIPVRNGSGHGHWTYTGASRATVVNTISAGTPAYNGKNILTVIRPTSRILVKAGGPDEDGNHFQDTIDDGGWSDISNNFSCENLDLYGQRHSQNPVTAASTELIAYHGRYHLQIQPSTIATTGDFLLVNEVGDSDLSPSDCDHVTGTNFAGVAIRGAEDRIAVFGSVGDTDSGTFIIPVAGTYKCLITNLSGTTRSFSGGANISSITKISDSSSSPFSVSSAKTLYLEIVVDSNGSGADNTVTVN